MVRRLLRIDRDNRSGVRSCSQDAPVPAREGRNHMAGKDMDARVDGVETPEAKLTVMRQHKRNSAHTARRMWTASFRGRLGHLQYVAGNTLWELMVAHPDQVEACLEKLVDVQLTEIDASAGNAGADAAILYVQTWMPMVASQQLT